MNELPKIKMGRPKLRMTAKAKERMMAGKFINPSQNSGQGKTERKLASVAGVSHDTIHKILSSDRIGKSETFNDTPKVRTEIDAICSFAKNNKTTDQDYPCACG